MAPRLEDWRILPDYLESGHIVLDGRVFGHPRFGDGTEVTTSPVVSVDFEAKRAVTRSGSNYTLGQRKK